MTYSLIEGLTAVSAYGVILIANTMLIEHIIKILLTENEDADSFAVYIYLIPLLGIAYLAGFLGHIILNSEFVIIENLKLFISLALALTIAVTHFKLFSNINSSFIQEKSHKNQFTSIVCALWGAAYCLFMISPDLISATVLFPIIFLPLISKHIIQNFTIIRNIIINDLKSLIIWIRHGLRLN